MCDDPLLWRTFYKAIWVFSMLILCIDYNRSYPYVQSEDFTQQEAALLAKLNPLGHDDRKDDDSSHAPGSDIETSADATDFSRYKLV